MCGIALYSQPFVLLVFGPQWHITADVLKWLAPTAIIQSILSTSGAVFMAKGKTGILMRLGVIGTILQVGAFLLGVHFSITTFAFFYLIANIVNFFPVMYCLLKSISGDFFSFFNNIKSIIFSTLGMVLILRLIDLYIFSSGEIKNIWVLLALSIFGACFYFSLLFISSPKFRDLIFKSVRKSL
ncbi:polysaccharide biosynthesis C-terminal domain-containing protein [Raoultella ornithinolytica]|uniref:polysaccharide biosynthesis C-terminal domain-containing protein n=1 Tax=Raoultella ornithinolytica TaxID=54291 RepID=UPI0022A84459|nr:polysaccharide biosynthesis C-terminal domain-containing protein [Raoultella ornithinolytica]MCZ0881467.1 polysaccharide biosynthesis C-terminal domain-containing protein [Raoultella ornithinolytica]